MGPGWTAEQRGRCEMREIWLVPQRDGMLRCEAKITRLGRQESLIIELLAAGGIRTPDEIADRLWPARRPDDWRALIDHRMVTVRKVLPRGFVKPVGERRGFILKRFLGWELTGPIRIEKGDGSLA